MGPNVYGRFKSIKPFRPSLVLDKKKIFLYHDEMEGKSGWTEKDMGLNESKR